MLGTDIGRAQAGPVRANVPAPQETRAPNAVALEFYGWYLDTLFADQDPLSDRHERFTAYVAQDLTKSLVERLQKKPLPHIDYFLQSSGYQPAWRHGVQAALLRRERAAAEVLVTLSAEDVPPQALLLTMVLENGAWKIRRVTPAGSRGRPERSTAESSTEQPVI